MSETENERTDKEQPETSAEEAGVETPAAERPVVHDSGPQEGVSGEPGASPDDEAGAGEEISPEAPAADAAPEAPAESAEEPSASETRAPEAPAAEQPPERPKSRKRLPRSERHRHSKPKRERPAERKPITRLPKPEATRGRRQERRGVVISSAMDKTIVVKVDTIKSHPRYKKVVRRSLKFHAHDPENRANVGDIVRIVETRPISKMKNWRLAEIVEAAK
jgi:small subunit ribosomal protein S17